MPLKSGRSAPWAPFSLGIAALGLALVGGEQSIPPPPPTIQASVPTSRLGGSLIEVSLPVEDLSVCPEPVELPILWCPCVEGAVVAGTGCCSAQGRRAGSCSGPNLCPAWSHGSQEWTLSAPRNGHCVTHPHASKQRGAGCLELQQCVIPEVSSFLVAV